VKEVGQQGGCYKGNSQILGFVRKLTIGIRVVTGSSITVLCPFETDDLEIILPFAVIGRNIKLTFGGSTKNIISPVATLKPKEISVTANLAH